MAAYRMKIHTLIPEITCYQCWVLLLLSLSSFSIAEHLCRRFIAIGFKNLLVSNCIVKLVIVTYGLLYIPIGYIFDDKAGYWLVFVLVGCVEGYLLSAIEKYYMPGNIIPIAKPYLKDGRTILSLSSSTRVGKREARQYHHGYYHLKSSALALLVSTSIAEEIIFRGFIVLIAFKNQQIWQIIFILMISVGVFSLSHKGVNTINIVLKGLYAVFLLVSTLLLHSIISAIVAHIVFNINVFRHNINCVKYDNVI